MEAYSKEMRRDVLVACDAGEGTRAVALRFGCSESWVRRVKQVRRECGKIAPSTTRRRIPRWAAYRERIEQIVAARSDITLQELKDELQTELSRQTLCVALRELKLTLKKSAEGGRTRSARRC
jgi:transposase